MTKYITFLLFFTFLFTACSEKGYTPKPVAKQTATTIKPIVANISTTKIQDLKPIIKSTKESTITKSKHVETVSTTVVPEVKQVNTEEESIFSLSHEDKKRISGVFILIIGLIILL